MTPKQLESIAQSTVTQARETRTRDMARLVAMTQMIALKSIVRALERGTFEDFGILVSDLHAEFEILLSIVRTNPEAFRK